MEQELITISFNSKIKPIKPINDQFTLCKCYVMAIGKNVNKSIISKEAVDDALPTLFNVPVVGHLYADEDGIIRMGGHDIVLEKDEDGKYLFKSITVPYGTVPQQGNIYYEEIEESDGVRNTYLVADIILWTGRYPELLEAIYSEDVYFGHSMEILPSETKKTKEGLEVNKFQFSALCLLGKSDDATKNVVPCFKSARVEPYKFSETGKWIELFSEFKEQLAKSYSVKDIEEGGKEKLNTETIKKILLEFGLAEDLELSFEVTETMTEDEFKEKIKAVYCQNESSEDPADNDKGTDPVAEEPKQTFNAAEDSVVDAGEVAATKKPEDKDEKDMLPFSVDMTYEEKRDAICKALGAYEVFNDELYQWYCLIDFDDTYAYSCYHISGKSIKEENGRVRIPYVVANDVVTLDMSSQEKVRQVWLTKAEEDKLTADKAQFVELVQYKADRIEDDKKKAFAEVISEFSDLGEIDEYKAVVKDAMAFESVEALSEKLYAIRGRYSVKSAKKPLAQVRIPVGFESKSKQSEYDEFMARYLAPAKN